ncbi:high mobility group box domain-containing protein [Phycomyces nitens]|nr:high mobility group box domain-containing protein [Phycomyces nitens]
MNNLPDNLHFSLPYTDFSQAQTLHNAVLNSPQMQQHPSSMHNPHLQDSPFSGLSSPYQSFPMLQAATTMQPPQLHQPTVDVTKDVKAKNRPKPRPPVENVPEPTRVTRPPNAFLLFNKEMRKQLKDQNPTMKVAEISKEIGSRWKCLGQTEKSRYVAEAERLKDDQRSLHPNAMYIRRSKAELVKAGHYTRPKMKNRPAFVDQSSNIVPTGNYLPEQSSAPALPRSTRSPRKRQRRDKNSATPKHPLSAYMWYLTEVRPSTMRAYPGSTVGQISKLCADQWNAMTESEQMPWKTKAHADKERYAREMQVYAAQIDHPMGRGTRQKYRSAAAASAAASAAAATTNSAANTPKTPSSVGSSGTMGIVGSNPEMINSVDSSGNVRPGTLNPSMSTNTSMSDSALQSSLQSTLQSTLQSRFDPNSVLCGSLPRMHLSSNILEEADQYVNTE